MLVLTRRAGERVIIDGDIEVTVLEVKGDSIKLGIRAPRSTQIQRAEIVDAVQSENREAAHAPEEDGRLLLKALAARQSR